MQSRRKQTDISPWRGQSCVLLTETENDNETKRDDSFSGKKPQAGCARTGYEYADKKSGGREISPGEYRRREYERRMRWDGRRRRRVEKSQSNIGEKEKERKGRRE